MSLEIHYKRLADIKYEVGSAVIVALIISKNGSTIFPAKDTTELRGVFTLTLRDSKRDVVNCKCWGSKDYIDNYQKQFTIGDVIDITGAKFMPCTINNERFQPLSTLNYTLVVNEGHGYIVKHDERDMQLCRELKQYQCISHKAASSALKLADVRCTNSNSYKGPAQYVDLLVAVAAIRPTKLLKTARKTQLMPCLELIVHDASWPDGMVFTIWSADWIQHAQKYWMPRKTILHLIDVRINYSEFYKCTILNSAACTVIYQNILGPEAEMLLQFATSAPAKDVDFFAQASAGTLPRADQIINQMTVMQIYDRADGELKDNAIDQFTAVLYATITTFDIDGQTCIISKKCKSCQCLIRQNQAECENDRCQLEFSLIYNDVTYEKFFNINVHFSDHTGTLVEARLSNAVAKRILGYDVDDFMRLTQTQRTQIKTRFLMNYFEVKLQIRKLSIMRRKLTIIVVDMSAITVEKLIQKMLAF